MSKVNAYSKKEFDESFRGMPLCSEIIKDNAFISITGNIDGESHILPTCLSVLNIRFDDIDADELDIWCYGENTGKLIAKGITEDQAVRILDFVLKNKDKHFHIHLPRGDKSKWCGWFIYCATFKGRYSRVFSEASTHTSTTESFVNVKCGSQKKKPNVMSDRYKKYIVEFELGGKKFRAELSAFNEDNVRLQVKNKIIFTSIEEKREEAQPQRDAFSDLFNTFFGGKG